MPIGEVLRARMYARDYGAVDAARREYAALGVTHFIGMFGRVDDLRSTRLFAESVLPAFR